MTVIAVMRTSPLSRSEVSANTPLRLSVAAALAYPDGTMTASGLRREAARGRLVIERTAGKDYTTLDNIERMRELCRVESNHPGFTSALREGTSRAGSERAPSGLSSMAASTSPQDALRAKIERRSRPSQPTIARKHFVEFNGQPVESVKTAFKRAVSLSKLEGKISPHTLRHTAATWLMLIGVSTWDAAGFLGMSEKTLRDVYGHHHADYLQGAAKAIGTKKPVSLVKSLVKQRQRRPRSPQHIENVGGPGRTRTSNQTVMSGRL